MKYQHDVKLIIAVHKDCKLPTGDLYVPVHVGAYGKEDIKQFVRDDTGDHISEKNPVFCELTGLYWAWKNMEYDWLGLVHYRRFFSSADGKNVLQGSDLYPMIERFKVFVPRKRHYYIESVYSHYDHTFDGAQLDAARRIIAEKSPDYVEDFDAFMRKRSAWLFNMMIMPRNLIDSYCSWLFSILFELEKQIDTSNMTSFEKRYAGRISERLFNVWLNHQLRTGVIHKKEVKELPYIYLGKIDWWKKCTGFLKAKFFKKKYTESF